MVEVRERDVMVRRTLLLVFFLALVVGGGLAIGLLSQPGEWYAELRKPSFTPPDWVFGPVWSVVYVLIAIAGWRTWLRNPHGREMTLWWIQLVLNFVWTPSFFIRHQIGISLTIIGALLAAIIAFIVVSWQRDRAVALMFVPYAAWVAYATALNAGILHLN